MNSDINKYISRFPLQTQNLLEELRETIKEVAPEAEEIISYKMPAFKLQGILVWYGGHTNHIGFYPRVSAIEKFKKELAGYKTSKGAIQFPVNKPLPIALIKKIVKFRLAENIQKAKKKS